MRGPVARHAAARVDSESGIGHMHGVGAAGDERCVRLRVVERDGAGPGAGVGRSHAPTHAAGRGTEDPAAERQARFEATMLPHLDAAYTLARHLMRDRADAEDAVQEAYLRAFRYFDGFRGGDGRAWLLTIVRNRCRTLALHRRRAARDEPLDESVHGELPAGATPEAGDGDVEVHGVTRPALLRALARLPAPARDILLLREVHGLSYREIGTVVGVPVGTVMSRLARARERLRHALAPAEARR